MPFFTKICCNEGFLPTSRGSIYCTLSRLTHSPSSLLHQQERALCTCIQQQQASLPGPKTSSCNFRNPATQPIKTMAKLWITYCMYYITHGDTNQKGFRKNISLSRQFFLHPQYSSRNDSLSPHLLFTHDNKTVLAIITSLYKLHYLCLSRGHRYLLRQIFEIRTIRIRGQ